MGKVWLKEYPKTIPAEIDKYRYTSLIELLEQNFQKYKNLPAFANMGSMLTYADLEQKSACFAAFLQQRIGLRKGDRIAIMMPNLLQYPIAILGALMAGLTVVNTNPLYTSRELKHQLNDSGATAIVILENYAHVLARVQQGTAVKHIILTRIGDLLRFPKSLIVNFAVQHIKKLVPAYSLPEYLPFLYTLSIGKRYKLAKPQLGHGDIAFLQYTGGTTGVAKGAMLSHGNVLANLEQALVWFTPPLEERSEVVITALPLYHIFSLLANCLLFIELGGLNYLITNPRDMRGFVKELSRVKFTCITGVNTLYNNLLNSPGFSNLDFSHLKLVLGGGMAIQPSVAQRWKATTGSTLIEAYGLTETSPAVCINPRDIKEYNGSIGLPIPSTECSIRDDRGNLLPFCKAGELCIRGPQVMKGYWKNPHETSLVLSPDGWLRTGDIATMDERGYVRILDRKKDMINVSGFNVCPNEVESVIISHPGVLEVAVIGVSDHKSGEAVKAVVVKKDSTLTAEALRKYSRESLSGYKVPKYIEFKNELPKTNVGKILRRKLREQSPTL